MTRYEIREPVGDGRWVRVTEPEPPYREALYDTRAEAITTLRRIRSPVGPRFSQARVFEVEP